MAVLAGGRLLIRDYVSLPTLRELCITPRRLSLHSRGREDRTGSFELERPIPWKAVVGSAVPSSAGVHAILRDMTMDRANDIYLVVMFMVSSLSTMA